MRDKMSFYCAVHRQRFNPVPRFRWLTQKGRKTGVIFDWLWLNAQVDAFDRSEYLIAITKDIMSSVDNSILVVHQSQHVPLVSSLTCLAVAKDSLLDRMATKLIQRPYGTSN